MKKKVIIPILFSFIGTSSNAQSIYNIVYEKQFHQNIGADNLNTGFHLIDYLDSLLIPKIISLSQNNFCNIINPIFSYPHSSWIIPVKFLHNNILVFYEIRC